MCKYCTDKLDWSELIKKDIIVNGKQFGGLWCCVEALPRENGRYIYAYVDGSDGEPIVEGDIKINYCPMCGEKLES